jgi:hypothetical protein
MTPAAIPETVVQRRVEDHTHALQYAKVLYFQLHITICGMVKSEQANDEKMNTQMHIVPMT